MSHRILHIVSGIPPGPSGTGRLLSHLMQQAEAQSQWDIRFHFPRRAEVSIRQLVRRRRYLRAAIDWGRVRFSEQLLRLKLLLLARFGHGAALVFHPQTLGFGRTIRFLRAWRGKAFLFGLDNSFFCVHSYNNVPGEDQDCLRCLGGRFEAAADQACVPFPVRDEAAFAFVRDLHVLLQEGGVGVLVQNRLNADLYRRHLGVRADVEVVGLWTADWTTAFASPVPEGGKGFDVVFHGHFVAAKGATWLSEVARRLPEVRFLFPASAPAQVKDLPENIVFRAMSWESGLAAEVAAARITCVPSLWSATIEGALVKSIIFGRATARVRTAAAFGEELPDGLVLNLDPDTAVAADQLRAALQSGWVPEPGLRDAWVETFKRENFDMLGRILRAIARRVKRGGQPSRRVQGIDALEQMRASDRGLGLGKLGTAYGGWVVPVDSIDADWVCYCVGAGEDISFDCELIERFGCEVFVFDPTPRAVAHVAELRERVGRGESMPINNKPGTAYVLAAEKLSRLHFQPFGVWSEDVRQRFYVPQDSSHVSHSILNLQQTETYFEADCRKLSSLMHEAGHDRIDLLKLDIEGAEYEVLKAMLADGILPRVLCVEFDEGNIPLDGGAPERISETAKALQAAGYLLVQQEGWNTTFLHCDELDRISGAAKRPA